MDKPIIYCLQYIREYLMKRICNVQGEIYRCHGPLTRTTTTLLDQIKRQAQKHRCIFNKVKTQVTTQWGDQFIMNLDEKSVGLVSQSITIIGMYLTQLGMVHLGCMASEYLGRLYVRKVFYGVTKLGVNILKNSITYS
uniref:Uncharacterized protein n=1 Tax=Lactuca sativa TaxID=4236 RepID=A0A9R1XXU3_LACSA|nr:hypothetical protein LSAT_V11C100041180 [Lactuca sativa]